MLQIGLSSKRYLTETVIYMHKSKLLVYKYGPNIQPRDSNFLVWFAKSGKHKPWV